MSKYKLLWEMECEKNRKLRLLIDNSAIAQELQAARREIEAERLDSKCYADFIFERGYIRDFCYWNASRERPDLFPATDLAANDPLSPS